MMPFGRPLHRAIKYFCYDKGKASFYDERICFLFTSFLPSTAKPRVRKRKREEKEKYIQAILEGIKVKREWRATVALQRGEIPNTALTCMKG